MPSIPLKTYQNTIERMLRNLYRQGLVSSEWRSKFENGIYSPRIDIAVGPFSIQNGRSFSNEYDSMTDIYIDLIRKWIRLHLCNLGISERGADFSDRMARKLEEIKSKNPNARCFIAIEIENQVTRKHLMGGAINCAALGRMGIVVGWTPEKLRALANLYRYFDFLKSVGKNTFDTSNLLVLDKNQLLDALEEITRDYRHLQTTPT